MMQIKNFICATGLMIILLIYAILNSSVPYLCILVASLLLILFSIRSLNETDHIGLQIGQLCLSALFCLLTTGFLPFLIFMEYRSLRWRKLRMILPAVFFVLKSLIWQQQPEIIIVRSLILLLLSAILYGMEVLVEHYMDAKSQVAQTVTVTAVNEMYQRQLNQELRLKNHLIDKNARLEERENISRNIHNSVGHSITAAIMTLDVADMLFDTQPEQAREKMRVANNRIHEGLESIRHAVRVLDTENVYVSSSDFIRELQEIINNFVMDTQIKVRADFPKEAAEQQIPHEHTEFLTGALQELLTNGVKHGNADVFTVQIIVDSSHIRMRVVDNGSTNDGNPNDTKHNGQKGNDNVEISNVSKEISEEQIKQGYGLKKIISYVKRCGGETHITEQNGWMTELTLPFERRE